VIRGCTAAQAGSAGSARFQVIVRPDGSKIPENILQRKAGVIVAEPADPPDHSGLAAFVLLAIVIAVVIVVGVAAFNALAALPVATLLAVIILMLLFRR
jgi:hypothetical protein